ncbi:MAG: YbaK/EbsC family protein [Desulfuromonadales bacterium]|nr:YbaK/EbsC family protein [Desulfuromonadales bacterium]MBN2793615.1 YbaK/EbsC family protein [Desulfuromonadales bacterium]
MKQIDEIKKYLDRHGIEVWEYQAETATSAAAAAAVGCSVAEIAKTLLFLIGEQPVAVVTCGDMKVKSSPLKKFFGLRGKVKFPQAEEVVEHTGYAPGGVCPFLLPKSLPVCLDKSLERFPLVYAAAGNSRSAVPVTLEQLQMLTGGSIAKLCEPI